MISQPKASSTPKILNIRKRRGIGEYEDSIQSPIANANDNSASESEYVVNESPSNHDDSHNRYLYCDNFYENNHKVNRSSSESNFKDRGSLRNNVREDKSVSKYNFTGDGSLSKNNIEYNRIEFILQSILRFKYMWIVVFILVISSTLLVVNTQISNNETSGSNISIEELSQQFPLQGTEFWLNIEVAINETNSLHGPQSVILYYQDDGEKTADSILRRISEYAACKITVCLSKPVVINGMSLRGKDILDDYGRVITKYKEQLEESGVMIVKNLENVPGISAQAFHSLCDEYNPVVKKALFLFTIKLESVQDSNMRSIENNFRHLWSDLDDDRFYPLFTRISSILLPVMKEK